jgi:hypothetical protein
MLFSTIEVTLDQVDGATPRAGLQSFESDWPLLGASFRVGIGYPVTNQVGVSLHGDIEIIEFEVGTSSILSTGVDLFVRI